MTSLRSGQLARAAGVTVQTLRFYERRGLLPDPPRSPGGHREYGPEALALLRTVRGLARIGFTLEEIAGLLEVGSHRGPRPGLRAAAAAKLAEVQERIADLEGVRAALVAVGTAECVDLAACTCSPDCPIPFGGSSPDRTNGASVRRTGAEVPFASAGAAQR